MEPIPSSLTKTYPARGPLRQFRFAESSAFRCFRCGNTKKAKLIAVYSEDWSRKLCNGCYGRLLSIYDIKAGTEPDHSRANQLANLLSALITVDQKREADREFCLADRRSEALSAEARHFIATAEYVAGHLETQANLEWSPAVIGLCKAIEMEVVSRVVIPLKAVVVNEDLYEDKQDRDMERIAKFCAGLRPTPPELGTIAHFLRTVIHSKRRRQTSPLIRCFLRLIADWVGSTWLLAPDGLCGSLAILTTQFRNRAAHVDELSAGDYVECRELAIGTHGIVWKLLLSTERHK